MAGQADGMALQREVVGALSHAELVERVPPLDARLEQRRHPLAGGDPHFHDPGQLFGTWRARRLDPLVAGRSLRLAQATSSV